MGSRRRASARRAGHGHALLGFWVAAPCSTWFPPCSYAECVPKWSRPSNPKYCLCRFQRRRRPDALSGRRSHGFKSLRATPVVFASRRNATCRPWCGNQMPSSIPSKSCRSNLGPYRAETSVDHQPAPDTAGHGKIDRRPYLSWSGADLAAWRVKDSNLGRHQPTDLQTAPM